MSDDDHADHNQRLKAATRQKDTPLNKDGGKGQVPCSPMQAHNGTKMPTGHVDVGTGRKS
jgi:hypothetical protein